MEVVVDVREVKKSFKNVDAVKGVDLQIHRGEFVALLGPNGAGKTTLVEMIEGLQKPDSGEILIKGKKWQGNEATLHQILGISLQETKFFERITVGETLEMFASFYSLPNERVSEILELVNLTEKAKTYIENCSGGQKQRLALGISLLNKPQILLLDEPTTGLDPVARREIWTILLQLKDELDTSLILTTHYMEEAEFLCDRIIILDKGKILAQGTLNDLLSEHNIGETIEFTTNECISNLQYTQMDGIRKWIWDSKFRKGTLLVNEIVTHLPYFHNFVREQKLTLTSFECRKMTLDDLFISMTGRKLDE